MGYSVSRFDSSSTRVTRPDSPIPAPFRHLPIAYNGRATSVRASGEPVRRPNGQWKAADASVTAPGLISVTRPAACNVASETPAGNGFGRAALAASASYRAQPTLSNGAAAAGARTRIAVTFQAPPD